jgi:uracil-DNA glycosylase
VLLYGTLKDYGFAHGAYGERADDGFALVDCRVTNAARCVPPENKPTPAEIATCRRFLAAEIAAMPRLAALLVLGSVAHSTVVATLGLRQAAWPFAHGRLHRLPDGRLLADSYHCSRYNTNTGRLTPAMFQEVVASVRNELGRSA